jgi:hypothetical protein
MKQKKKKLKFASSFTSPDFFLNFFSVMKCLRSKKRMNGSDSTTEAGAHSTTPTYTVRRDGPAREPSWSAFWLQKPSILRACVKEEDAGGREAGAHSTTPTYTVRRDDPARSEPSWSAFWLQKPSILRACVREEDAGGREAGAPLDLKIPLENGRADERVSRGQASERAVCVCEAVSVEMGGRPPLPTAVVCPPGRRRRRRLAITAVGQTSPHRPRLVVSRSTMSSTIAVPPLEHLCNRYCSNKHTHITNMHEL